MKLVFCSKCQDVFKLRVLDVRECHCGACSGFYLKDGLHAKISGPAIPLGFSNPSLSAAIHQRPEKGPGAVFTAFVIEKNCPTIKLRPEEHEKKE